MKLLCSLLALAAAPLLAAHAQTAPVFTTTCQDYAGPATSRQRYCETRDLTMQVPAGQTLTVDGGANGSIAVRGWDGPEVRIRAQVQVWGRSEATQALAKEVSISTTGNILAAKVPSGRPQWSVSYEIFVPRQLALALRTTNGGISLADVQATVDFSTVNGGVALTNVGGRVAGKTENGGLALKLGGSTWAGSGLDVSTQNGSIVWTLPPDYSAQLYTRTEGGEMQTTLPGRRADSGHRHELSTSLGKGGSSLKATTINGSVVIQ